MFNFPKPRFNFGTPGQMQSLFQSLQGASNPQQMQDIFMQSPWGYQSPVNRKPRINRPQARSLQRTFQNIMQTRPARFPAGEVDQQQKLMQEML